MEIDQIITVVLKTNMAVGCIFALILDNALPGTPEERGVDRWQKLEDDAVGEQEKSTVSLHVYDPISPKLWMNKKWLKYIPFLPYYPNERSAEQNNVGVELMSAMPLSEAR